MEALEPLHVEEAVKVFVRVRPLNAEDHERGFSAFHLIDEDANSITLQPPSAPELATSGTRAPSCVCKRFKMKERRGYVRLKAEDDRPRLCS